MIIIIGLSWTRLFGSMWIVILWWSIMIDSTIDLWWSMWNVLFFNHSSQPRFTRITSRFDTLTLKTQDVCHLHHCSWLIIHLMRRRVGVQHSEQAFQIFQPKGKFMKICQWENSNPMKSHEIQWNCMFYCWNKQYYHDYGANIYVLDLRWRGLGPVEHRKAIPGTLARKNISTYFGFCPKMMYPLVN